MNNIDGLNIQIKDLDDLVCENCSNPTFSQVFAIKKVPATLSPYGKEAFIPMPVYQCTNCGEISDQMYPNKGEGLVS